MMVTNDYQYDVLYLGSGHGAFNGALALGAKGDFKIGMVEADKVGGTCPNRGCNAKIALDMPVKLKHEAENMQGKGIQGIPKIDWAANVAHEKEVIKVLPGAIEESLVANGVEMIHGYGKLVDPHTIRVAGTDYTATNIVIATGAHYHQLDIPGAEFLHDGTDFLSLSVQPKELTIVGGGYIAVEFASIAATAGTKVNLLLHHDTALRQFYQPFVADLLQQLVDQGVNIVKNVTPEAVKKTANGYDLQTNQGTFSSDWILNATGRDPNTSNLGLDEVGIAYDQKGIKVNDHLQTSVPSIYASGDVLDKKVGRLTPTAIYESTYLTKLFAHETSAAIKYPAVPSAVFTMPRIAQVGVTVDEAKQHPETYKVVESDLAGDWFRVSMRANRGKAITIFDQEGYLVGMTEISSEADNAIGSILPFIEYHIDPEQMNDFITLFPTISSETKNHL
ncbi:pyruvate 2-oxoglutarate dehydrogenase complex, dihydrolipoamide dehydrogenase (E3) component [Fructilactobacillus florum DSM 22689 = JCM 16035]|uniref:Pyruvate 2-oxoglutarate dehydrogenase complex, dihydrolipoamide dehydrogenase (E3) component n=2 Tax=Fructilactobacillus florum TaxID=640331 RepID=A0A0R2CMU6_9LACO|nr:pyruvate 2-oxoglutarate dehydrogenase complex, dihydrolipoamide dehydrogenase (E3) component [Fructilactobacillus florum DSM 22689 = JCM 16035]